MGMPKMRHSPVVYGVKSELCKNCTVCGKLCVLDGECADCTERVAECVSSTNPKTELPKSRTMFKLNT